MITYFDRQIGGLVAELDRLGILDNTLIVITSDNGPASNSCSSSEWFDSARPFRCGKGWGKSFAPRRGHPHSFHRGLGRQTASARLRPDRLFSRRYAYALRSCRRPHASDRRPFRSGRFSTAAGIRCGSTSTFIGSFPEATDGWLCVGAIGRACSAGSRPATGRWSFSTWPTTRARHTT